MTRTKCILLLAFVILLENCRWQEKSSEESSNPDSLFMDCRISGNQEDSLITVLLQFKQDDEEGDATRLQELSGVTLDGELFKTDSSRMTGFYYEIQKPLKTFTGGHEIVFSAANGKTYREKFSFQPFALLDSLMNIRYGDSLVLHFSGLEKEDYIRIVMADTSFPGRGINRVDTAKNGRIVISSLEMARLVPGPVQAIFARETEKPMEISTKAGGRLSIIYTFKKEFELGN